MKTYIQIGKRYPFYFLVSVKGYSGYTIEPTEVSNITALFLKWFFNISKKVQKYLAKKYNELD